MCLLGNWTTERRERANNRANHFKFRFAYCRLINDAPAVLIAPPGRQWKAPYEFNVIIFFLWDRKKIDFFIGGGSFWIAGGRVHRSRIYFQLVSVLNLASLAKYFSSSSSVSLFFFFKEIFHLQFFILFRPAVASNRPSAHERHRSGRPSAGHPFALYDSVHVHPAHLRVAFGPAGLTPRRNGLSAPHRPTPRPARRSRNAPRQHRTGR